MSTYSLTSESVCAGHPDKICDQISDAVLDAALTADKYARVAVETLVTKDFVALAGEVSCAKKLDYKAIARKTIKKLGYTQAKLGFTDKSPITVRIHEQSREIAVGVDTEGAGDQGMMFGYATNETKEFMPLSIVLAHRLAEAVDLARIGKTIPHLRPDGKTQITLDYQNGHLKNVAQVVIAVPHEPAMTLAALKRALLAKVVQPLLKEYGLKITAEQLLVNGTGHWYIGGPASDTGVTGRKIVVDSYGSIAHVGGGCFSGKDPTKVDRSGAYAARFYAKNLVAAGLAARAEVRLAYVIGTKVPVMLDVDTFDTATKPKAYLLEFMRSLLNPSVGSIINDFDLRRPMYAETAAYGHFGRNGFPWEKVVVV